MGFAWTTLIFVLLATGAYQTSRYGFRQPRGSTTILGAVVLGWTWLTVGVQGLGLSGLLTCEALLGWSATGFAVGVLCRALGRRPEDGEPIASTAEPWRWEEVISLSLVLWAAAILGTTSLFYWVKVVSDGPIYHLYFAARWWKSHRLELIPIPFGESAAPYFPAVGDLWYTWLMIAWGGDRLAKIGQVPFFAVVGLTTFALARRLGASRASSIVATSWFLTATPFLLFSFEPNVDTILVAGFLLAVYFFARHALGDDGLGSLVLGALASGAALGTKATGVVFVPPLLILALISALVRASGPGRKALGALVVCVCPLVLVGFWYVRNFLFTGNPLYPLHLTVFGRVWLAGWYGPGVMKRSQYYIPMFDWRSLVDQVVAVLDPRFVPFWVAALAGGWYWRDRRKSSENVAVWGIAALAVANVALYWLAIPYRTQQRFMFHAVGLAVIPLARLLDRSRWLRVVGVVLLAVHLVTPPTWLCPGDEPPWDLTPVVPNGSVRPVIPFPVDGKSFRDVITSPEARAKHVIRIAILAGAIAVVSLWSRVRGPGSTHARKILLSTLATLAFLVGSAALYYPWGVEDRRLFLPAFPEYFRGWVEVDLRSGKTGVTIAYAGTNLPYYLMGVGLRNNVRYVNINAHRHWLMHDYHQDASRLASGPATWNFPRPGWDRIHPDYAAWLANLRAEGVQLLVVTRANPEEGAYNLADPSGFPIEYVWAKAHPELFEVLYGDENFRLYRVRSLAKGVE